MKIWNLSRTGDTLEITIYGEIGADWFTGESTDKQIAQQLQDNRDAAFINVHINSDGGDVFAGIAIFNMLRAHGAVITCFVEGIAASAASIIAMAGKTVMGTGAMIMVHNPLAIVAGGADELRTLADALDKIKDSLVAIYVEKTGKTAAELGALLDAETWMTADEAIEMGFADEKAEVPIVVEARADFLFINSIPFKRGGLPQKVLNMANKPDPIVPVIDPAEVERTARRPQDPQLVITREVLALKGPDVLAAVMAEGHAAGVAAERARLKAIDDLIGGDEVPAVIEAKYGATPTDADKLAGVLWRSRADAKVDVLAKRRAESAPLAGVRPVAPDINASAADKQRDIQDMVDVINRRRGGSK